MGRKYLPNSFPPELVPSTCTRRKILHLSGGAFGLGIAGCSSAESSEPDVSNRTARRRALAAEESYLTDHLQNASCLEDWGTTETTVSKRATVTKRTSDGVYVEVTHPYWYYTDETEADLGSDALYVVTDETTERKRGESISPSC